MLKACIVEGTDRPHDNAIAVQYIPAPSMPDGSVTEARHNVYAAKETDGVWQWFDVDHEIMVLIGEALLAANTTEGTWFWCMLVEVPA